MKHTLAALAVATLCAGALAAQAPAPADALFDKFFAAESPAEAQPLGEQIAASGAAFDDLYARLKKGRTYLDEKRGEYALRWKSKSGPFYNNMVDVPEDYDPAQKWMLRVQLHGGVGRPSPNVQQGRGGNRGGNRIAGEKQIVLQPSAWASETWWDDPQVDNVLKAVDALKRKYNIDESSIYLTGISDGGTGTYYMAIKEPTLFASFLPLNGSLAVLRNPDTGADSEMHGNNLVNSPLYIVNGENDPLYPVVQVEPHVAWLKKMGVNLVFRPQAGAEHNTNWWPTERAPYEAFVHAHPRVAYPGAITWETERVDRFNRYRWLVINEIRNDAVKNADLMDMGFFRHAKRSGRVDIRRNGNRFDAVSRDVAAFTLLLSPDMIDFSKPVVVTVNGKPAFEGAVKKDAATLLRWAAKDNDRTALYGAELKIAVP